VSTPRTPPNGTPPPGPIRAGLRTVLTGGEPATRVEKEWGTILTGLLDGTRMPLDDYRRFIRERHDPWAVRQADMTVRLTQGLADTLSEKPLGSSAIIGTERFLAALPMLLDDARTALDASLFPLLQRHERLAWDAILYPDTYEPRDSRTARWIADLGRTGTAADSIPLAMLHHAILPLAEDGITGAHELATHLSTTLTQLDTAVLLWEVLAHHGHEALAALPVPPHLHEPLNADWLILHAERPLTLHLRILRSPAQGPLNGGAFLLDPDRDLTDPHEPAYAPGSVAARHIATTGLHGGAADSISPRDYARLQQAARALLPSPKPTPPRQLISRLYERISEELSLNPTPPTTADRPHA
jgi:hypothetical protein